VFVPEELNKTTFVQSAKDWTQILYQFGLGIAGIVAASR
jgi:polysaccharide biosynthesis/export protein